MDCWYAVYLLRLWLNDVNQSIAQQCVPFLAQRLTDAMNEATTSFSLSSMMACEVQPWETLVETVRDVV